MKAEPKLIKAAINMKMIRGTKLESDKGFMVELKTIEGEYRNSGGSMYQDVMETFLE